MTGTNASAACFKGLLEGLDSTTLESIFPNGSTSHNYYPFSMLLVGCCTVAVVMRVKDSARNDTRVSPEQQGSSNNYGNVGAASTGVYYARRNRSNRSQAEYLSTQIYTASGRNSTFHGGGESSDVSNAAKLVTFRTNIFLNSMVCVILLMSSMSWRLMLNET